MSVPWAVFSAAGMQATQPSFDTDKLSAWKCRKSLYVNNFTL